MIKIGIKIYKLLLFILCFRSYRQLFYNNVGTKRDHQGE